MKKLKGKNKFLCYPFIYKFRRFVPKDPISLRYQPKEFPVGSGVKNSFSFSLSENVITLPLFLKEIFSISIILSQQSFSFKRLFWNPFHCHFASGFDEMPVKIHIMMMYYFVSGHFQGFLILVFSSRTVTCLGMIYLFFILAYPIWSSLRFLHLYFHDSHQILKTGPLCIFCSVLSVSCANGIPVFDILNILTL